MFDQAVKDAAIALEGHLLAAASVDAISIARATYDIKKDQWMNQSSSVILNYGKKPNGFTLFHNAAVKQAEDFVHWENIPANGKLWAQRQRAYEQRLSALQRDIAKLYPSYEKLARPSKVPVFGKTAKTAVFVHAFRTAFTAWYKTQRVTPNLILETIDASMTRFLLQHKELIAALKAVHVPANPAQPGYQLAQDAVDLNLALIAAAGTNQNIYPLWEAEKILLIANTSELERAVLATAFLLPLSDRLFKAGRIMYTPDRLANVCGGSAAVWKSVIVYANRLLQNRDTQQALDGAAEMMRLKGKLSKQAGSNVLAKLPIITNSRPISPTPEYQEPEDMVLTLWKELCLKNAWIGNDPAFLDQHALRRILTAGPNVSQLQCHLLSELAESHIGSLLRQKLGIVALGIDLPSGCVLEFVPGHAISIPYDLSKMRAPQISDGMLGYYFNGTFYISAIIEIKFEGLGCRELPFSKIKLETLTRQERSSAHGQKENGPARFKHLGGPQSHFRKKWTTSSLR
ncbi:hypothetical protein N7533_011031 [Penicillium manginii]|uniref:uncharacterized protein n=1 Tax=Penicillium manginii TaxID=203109 RepID=UPI00254739E7|nr:uncharacterized protein N7533_011031 [Penicillium manginii]KAJ5741622.1 hypothetical protein N7533_011031 [Penicillium manginii]